MLSRSWTESVSHGLSWLQTSQNSRKPSDQSLLTIPSLKASLWLHLYWTFHLLTSCLNLWVWFRTYCYLVSWPWHEETERWWQNPILEHCRQIGLRDLFQQWHPEGTKQNEIKRIKRESTENNNWWVVRDRRHKLVTELPVCLVIFIYFYYFFMSLKDSHFSY